MQQQHFQQAPMQQTQSTNYVTTMPSAVQQPTQTAFVSQTVVSSGTGSGRVSGMKSAIPDLPYLLALTYGILNFFFPGIGTILAGISVLFCGSLGQTDSNRFNAFCLNIFVGLLQAGLAFLFIGWIWSVIWGIAIISNSGTSVQELQPPTSTVTVSTNQIALPQPTFQQPQAYQQPMMTAHYPQPMGQPQLPPQPQPVSAWS